MSGARDRDHEKALIKQRVSLTELLREIVAEVDERGGDVWACCPFHAEDTPSFHVVPAKGFFKCFGCGEKGDVFTFVQKTRGVDFREALEILAERAGVVLGSLSPEDRRRVEQTRRQRQVLDEALVAFRRALAGAEGRTAARYLAERGFTPATLEAFDVGYVPESPGGPARPALEAAGFTRQFAGRVAFGIRDAHGALVGFGARRLGEGDGPKYVNTRETPAFSKGRLLYGLDKASRTVARTRRLVVMEGYTDVMMAHQRGLTEAVATMGTSLTTQHVELLRGRGVRNLILVFDGDEPGAAAAERAAGQLLVHGVEGRVVSLPAGRDPCEWFADHDVEDFDRLVAQQGLDGVSFLCRRALAGRDPGQPGVREEIAREVAARAAPLLDDVLRREGVLAGIARECGLSPNVLRALVAPPAGRASGAGRPRGPHPASAHVRCQLIAVAGLLDDAARLPELDALEEAGALEEPAARALLAHARALLGEGTLDATGWLATAGAHSPALEAMLERLLAPPPSVHLEGYGEAVAHLRERVADHAARRAIRAATARTDLLADPHALSELQARLRRRHASGSRSTEG